MVYPDTALCEDNRHLIEPMCGEMGVEHRAKRLADALRAKLRDPFLPRSLSHMRRLPPAFGLEPLGDGAYAVYWRRHRLTETLPLSELRRPMDPECFILATGPSIGEMDLMPLRGRSCMGVNGSIVLSDELPFTYHLMSDRNFFRARPDLVDRALASGSDCILSFTGLALICERAPERLTGARVFIANAVNVEYGVSQLPAQVFDAEAARDPAFALAPGISPSDGRVGFSWDIRRGIFSGQTIVYAALQIAVWLGFRRIFLLGMDLGGGPTRFYEQGSKGEPTRLDEDYEPYILPAFALAGELLRSKGLEVYNLSPTSRLPANVIPKISLARALTLGASRPRRNGIQGVGTR
jgi:Kdo-III transferase WaaZ